MAIFCMIIFFNAIRPCKVKKDDGHGEGKRLERILQSTGVHREHNIRVCGLNKWMSVVWRGVLQ